MNERDDEHIQVLLRDAIPPVNADLRRDLWPAMARRLDAQAPKVTWHDWALAGLAGVALAASPDLILVLFYHL
jgi:hypothetical protein